VNLNGVNNVYFLGIGGIGMSSLARYFQKQGKSIAGYDRTPTNLTAALEEEGMVIHYQDDINQIPEPFLDKENTLVVFTPAIPASHSEYQFYTTNNFQIFKRSRVLGEIVNTKKGIAVAGTHGKTTVSSMIATLLKNSKVDCSAFLGGLVKNFNNNFVLSENSEWVVAEADEYDRSFLQLHPYIGIVTAMDADHLDIYENHNDLKQTFNQFANQIQPNGCLLYKHGLPLQTNIRAKSIYTYSLQDPQADFFATNLQLNQGVYNFQVDTPFGKIKNITCRQRGLVNVENAVAAIAAACLAGVDLHEISQAFAHFEGIWRRFDYQITNDNLVFIDDYAHHPAELEATIRSVRELYPNRNITGIFQPHLFSRTRDFAAAFGSSLSLLDQLILLDIYPAREEPIPGVSSQMIFDHVNLKNKKLINKKDLLKTLRQMPEPDILLTLGAGDIDKEVEPIKQQLLTAKYEQ